jgi:hypothetical protein
VLDANRNIVWIASYPKSGNTWLRFLVCNLLYGRQESAAALSLLAPDIHEAGPDVGRFPGGLLKTHFVYSERLPLVERTAAAVYVVRNPADVIASNYHYARRSGRDRGDTPAAFDQYFEGFLKHRGDPGWAQLGMGTWEENLRSWLDGSRPFPVLCIRYEDLVADARPAARALVRMLRPAISEQEIAQAVENSSFQRMREIEEADIRNKRVGVFYKPYLQDSIGSGSRFMRQGTVGDGLRRLSARQQARLGEAFHAPLSRLGYMSRHPVARGQKAGDAPSTKHLSPSSS